MNIKTLILAALAAACLVGCSEQNTKPSMSAPVPESTVQDTLPFTSAPALPETEPITEPETLPTEPALNIAAGAYQLKYEDDENKTYMEYYTFIPENATENMPLVIFLHGDGEVGRIWALENNAMMTSVREIYGNSFPFIAIAPCTRSETWIDWTIPDTLMNLIEYVVTTYCIDTDHIIITGHSRGAVGVWYYINTYGDYFSAAVPISCFSWQQFQMDVITQVPIRAFCGNYEEFERNYSYTMSVQIEEIVHGGGTLNLYFITAQHMLRLQDLVTLRNCSNGCLSSEKEAV